MQKNMSKYTKHIYIVYIQVWFAFAPPPQPFQSGSLMSSEFIFLSDKSESSKVILMFKARAYKAGCILVCAHCRYRAFQGVVCNYIRHQRLSCNPKTKRSISACLHSNSEWFSACVSSRGGSHCPGTAPPCSLSLTDTFTSPTPLQPMQASIYALPPVLWATPAERFSSVSTVRKINW